MRRIATALLLTGAIFNGVNHAGGVEPKKNSDIPDRAVLLSAPRPEYPYEARRSKITGTGIAVMTVDPSTGKVTSVQMTPSTGSIILDRAAVSAFRQWRFKPGSVTMARLPITFTMAGTVLTEYRVKEKPMAEALAAFLGKGTVVKGPIPVYPRSVPWTAKQGTGVFELHVQKDGRVGAVNVLKGSGDEIFDRAAVDTLRKWRLRRGPLILELPLRFNLTPTSYAVDIPKDR